MKRAPFFPEFNPDIAMTDQKYNIVGSFTHPQVGDASLLFVHVDAAKSVQDAQDQLQALFPHDVVYATFAGHLQPLDGGHALQLLSGGRLLQPGESPATEPPPTRRADLDREASIMSHDYGPIWDYPAIELNEVEGSLRRRESRHRQRDRSRATRPCACAG